VSLKLPYKKYPTPFAKCGFYYSASVPVNIALPAKNSLRSKRFDAIIDSGASSCLFHVSIGHAIGLEIEKGVHTQTLGIAGAMDIYVHEIALYAPGGIIITNAGFSKDLPLAGLLGMEGFFENFHITFDTIALRVELERLYQA
jgi:hypothetical protein